MHSSRSRHLFLGYAILHESTVRVVSLLSKQKAGPISSFMKRTANPEASATSLPALPLRLGIIGCGGILRKIYSEVLSELSGQARVVGLCDVAEESLSQVGGLFPSARGYLSLSQMLNQEKLDAVMVLSSESANARLAMDTLAAGIPTYLEKPPALTREEFDRLRLAEDQAKAPLFVSFNRRHTPLLQGIELPGFPSRIEGRMERLERTVSDFPYTALHLVDSLLYFSQASPTVSEVFFTSDPVPGWRLDCQLNGTCVASLEVIPDGGTHCEYLNFSGQGWSVDIQFPNPESHFCEGEVTHVIGDRREVLFGEKGISAHEHMGYAPSLRGFLQHVSAGQEPPAIYRLSTCRSAIALMEDMMDAYLAQASSPQPATVPYPSQILPHESH